MPDLRPGLFSSLQFRLALGFVLALGLALALIGVAAGVVADRQTERFERDRDSAQVERVRQLVSDYYAKRENWREGSLQTMLERAGPLSGSRIRVYDDNGSLIADSHTYLMPPPIGKDGKDWWKRKDEPKKIPVFQNGQQVGIFTLSTIDLPDSGSQRPAFANPVASRISEVVNRSLFWAGIGAAAIGTLLVWFLSRRTLAPLQSLGAAARRLGSGDFSQRAETTGPTEIRELAHSFNVMAEGLEEAERQRRNLTADVAHELRTPLSNIQGYLEAIRDGLVDPTPEAIDTIHGQALHLSRLVEDLRLLAQVEAGALQLQPSPVRIDELLQSSVEAVRPRAEGKGVDLSLDVAPSLPTADLDETRIAQVVGNLLENAITHTPEGGRVSVSARVLRQAQDEREAVEVTIADTGSGISSEELPRLFDRFYRVDPSRDRSTGGAGLGLTIARRLVEAHGAPSKWRANWGRAAGSRSACRLLSNSTPGKNSHRNWVDL